MGQFSVHHVERFISRSPNWTVERILYFEDWLGQSIRVFRVFALLPAAHSHMFGCNSDNEGHRAQVQLSSEKD